MGSVHRFIRPGSVPDVGAAAATIDGLYTAEHRAMLQLATLLLGSAADAEDIVHDAFAKVEHHFDRLDRPGAYLRTCVVNGCRSRMRHQKVVDRHLHAARAEAALTSDMPTHLVELREALAVLDERPRTVIVLRYFVDLPDTEIAQIVGVSPTTVRTIIHRALKVLRAELDPPSSTDHRPSGAQQ